MTQVNSVRTQVEAIRNQTISASDLVSSCLEKADKSDSVFISIDHQIQEKAAQIDSAIRKRQSIAALSGVPITLKDLFDVQGETTLAGSIALKHSAKPAQSDCDVVKPLREAGLLFLGRTNMSEFAFSGMGMNPHYGNAKSIWDRETGRLPGGSSSGSAVSVAEGIVSATMGSDTAGSCRIPAAFNGIVGVKPSFGRLSLNGVYPLSPTSDAPGPLGLDVDSCFILDQLISGAWDGQGAIPDLSAADCATLKLLLPEGIVMDELDDEVARDFERAVAALGDAGVDIQTVAMPVVDQCVEMFMTRAVVGYEALKHHAELLEKYADEYDPFVGGRMRNFVSVTDEEQEARYRDKAILKAEFTGIMNGGGFDAIIYPTTACIPPKMSDAQIPENTAKINLRCLRNTASANYYDGCSMSLPMQTEGTAPTGLMLSAVHGEDVKLYAMAAAIEPVLNNAR